MATPRKPGRRTNQQGTVSKLPNGKYQARTPYFQDPDSGRSVRRAFTADTWSAAETRMQAYLREFGGSPARESRTVADALDGFLDRYERRVSKAKSSAKTLEQYRWAAAHVKPHLGAIAAERLTPNARSPKSAASRSSAG
ncbi:MAG: hypothetical protein ABSD78_15960 [Acidimicrobiales bacterium]|jgi:hypothetical protein